MGVLRRTRFASYLVGFALALGLSGCGSDSGTSNTVVTPPPPTPRPPMLVDQFSGPLTLEEVKFRPFNVPATGVLEVTLDWTLQSNEILVLVAQGQCTGDELLADLCRFVAGGDSLDGTTKPMKLRAPVATPGIFTVLIGNAGPGDDSISYQAVLLPSTAASTSVTTASSRSLNEWAQKVRLLTPPRLH